LTRKLSCLLRGVHSDMKTKMTICGPIPADKIGLKSMHDHIQADLSFFKQPITDNVEKDNPINLKTTVSSFNVGFEIRTANNKW